MDVAVVEVVFEHQQDKRVQEKSQQMIIAINAKGMLETFPVIVILHSQASNCSVCIKLAATTGAKIN